MGTKSEEGEDRDTVPAGTTDTAQEKQTITIGSPGGCLGLPEVRITFPGPAPEEGGGVGYQMCA